MNIENGQRSIREYWMEMAAGAEDIFPLLCPVREYDWIPQWRCKIVYTESGFAELGCVIQTDFDDQYGVETWVVSHYEKDSKIAFVRTGEHRTTRYEITLTSAVNSTMLFWRQEITGLSSKGNDQLTPASEDEFQTIMKHLEQLLIQYLAT
jgi:hypothetical protein